MKATEKTDLLNMLNCIDSYACGFKSSLYENIQFTDDKEPACECCEETSVSIETDNTYRNTVFSIAEKISRCNHCRLSSKRTNTVPGEGVQNPLVLVIGEAPGYDEDMQGRPFVGRAGQLLDRMLGAIYLFRNKNCFITNVIKCRPPENRDPAIDELAACSSFLEAQIKILKPKFILIFGRIAAHSILKTSDGIGKLRGKFFDYNGIPLMATYHPSALLRNETLKKPAWEDLKLFAHKILEEYPDYRDNNEMD